MRKISNVLLIVVLLSVSLFSCKKNEEAKPDKNKTGNLVLKFDNVVGVDGMMHQAILGKEFKNSSNEAFIPSTIKYFVSNVVLEKADGKKYTIPQDDSYFLIDESVKASQYVTLKNIPQGNYKKVSFMIGVDSLRNTKPIEERTGALDISEAANGMYWKWKSGYIFMKFEGTSSAIKSEDVETPGKFYYHIGLFGSTEKNEAKPVLNLNNTRVVTLELPSNAKVVGDIKPEVHIIADFQKFFTGSTTFTIKDNAVVMASLFSAKIADNYMKMFEVHHVHNEAGSNHHNHSN